MASARPPGQGRLPTGAVNNSVLAFGARHTAAEPEVYALALAEHFLDAAPPVDTAEPSITSSDLTPLEAAAPPSGVHSDVPSGVPSGVRHFTAGRPPRDVARVALSRDGTTTVLGGLRDVELFVTGGATFTGFARDAFTTTRTFTDRVFGARLDVTWWYARASGADHGTCRNRAHRAVVEALAGHTSRSSQHTFCRLGTAVLDACPDVTAVRVEGAHLTRALVDLTPFGTENDGRVYTAADTQRSTVSVDVHRTGTRLPDHPMSTQQSEGGSPCRRDT
ncbi:hypothetical protein [Streptomyces sp. I05A-00742]|uniref:hypothetical protein n=1 Tax=Streptomyces sp. I05A-00742 TaxID=2732853 RepID=UPI001489C89C|nr:hypothetical protein [Streptomyces sp. I05A-00742]